MKEPENRRGMFNLAEGGYRPEKNLEGQQISGSGQRVIRSPAIFNDENSHGGNK
jgi:hypothetical protein